MTDLGTHVAQRYDLYDLAHLAGGHPRVVDTAVVALVRSGRVKTSDGGQLSAVPGTRQHPVEAAVLDVIGPRPLRSIGTVRWRLENDERLTAIPERLSRDGLIRTAPMFWVPRRPVVRTAAGRRLLRRLSAEPPVDVVAPGTGALAVALGGPAAMTDRELFRRIFCPPAPPRTPGRWTGARVDGGTSAYAYGGGGWGAWGGDGGWGGGGWGGGFGDGGCGGFGGGDGGGGGGGDGGGGC